MKTNCNLRASLHNLIRMSIPHQNVHLDRTN